MKKKNLNLEKLQVKSFVTTLDSSNTHTVKGGDLTFLGVCSEDPFVSRDRCNRTVQNCKWTEAASCGPVGQCNSNVGFGTCGIVEGDNTIPNPDKGNA